MSTAFLKDVFHEKALVEAIVWQGRSYDYAWLTDRIAYWVDRLTSEGIGPGDVTLLCADFSPNAVAVLLALVEKKCICVPLNAGRVEEREVLAETALANWMVEADEKDSVTIHRRQEKRGH